MTDDEDDAPSEQPAINAVREAMMEMLVERWRACGMSRDEIDCEVAKRAKHGEYDLGTDLRKLMRQEPIVIPAGATGRPCYWCKMTVYWIPFRNTPHNQSVSIAGSECCAPTATSDGLGFAHLADCGFSGLRLKEYGTIALADVGLGQSASGELLAKSTRNQSRRSA